MASLEHEAIVWPWLCQVTVPSPTDIGRGLFCNAYKIWIHDCVLSLFVVVEIAGNGLQSPGPTKS